MSDDDLPRDHREIGSYHAHVYFDATTRERAARLHRWVAARFLVELGPWRSIPFGPHTTPSFYFGFTPDLLPVLLPWLMLNSLGLSILIHPNTDDAWHDHITAALWLNDRVALNDAMLPRSLLAIGAGPEKIIPNTRPMEAQ